LKQIILGTAGHIDHGKTSLIKALTGTDTDRLKEEKLRGITIELGFAALDLPSGLHVGVVDVPGHEKFIKNMVAGATGIDIVTMVVATDEGVMPQTREHMEICSLLGIRHGLVVLSKVDLVDEEWLELVRDDIATFVRGTFLEAAPVLGVSAQTGQGLPEFMDALDAIAGDLPERHDSGLFRLPIDRVFTMRGFGTVITGTIISGAIEVGAPITLYPDGIVTKVRGIQVHNQSVEKAGAGQRTAINFQGLDLSVVSRGDVLAAPNSLIPSFMADLHLNYLTSNAKPLKNRTRVRFHTGTSEVMGVLVLLDHERCEPGQSCFAQIRLEGPLALMAGDRFVVRSYSPVRTIGGGVVLNPLPSKHKQHDKGVVTRLEVLFEGDTESVVMEHIKSAGHIGRTFAELRIMSSLSAKRLEAMLQKALAQKTVVLLDRDERRFLHTEVISSLRNQVEEQLSAFHRAAPLKAGMPKEELRSKMPARPNAKLFTLVLNQLLSDNLLQQDERTVRLSDHQVNLGVDQTKLREEIAAIYDQSGLTPPYFKDVVKRLEADPAVARDVLTLLVEEGRVVKVKEDLYFGARAIVELQQRLVDFLKTNREISTPEFKDMTGASRKYVIPLIEHFDARHVTIRIGDTRRLRGA
jgi:selenocysteine-specific elongation factor